MPYYKGRVVVHGIDRAFGCPAANLDEAIFVMPHLMKTQWFMKCTK
jgi:hypothetical protein